MEKKKKMSAIDRMKKAFIYDVAEAILQYVEDIEQVMYTPKAEFSSQIQVVMKSGIKHILSVNTIEKTVAEEFGPLSSELR